MSCCSREGPPCCLPLPEVLACELLRARMAAGMGYGHTAVPPCSSARCVFAAPAGASSTTTSQALSRPSCLHATPVCAGSG